MGLKEKLQKMRDARGFVPGDLSESTVKGMFNRCIADSETPRGDFLESLLFSKYSGLVQHEKPIYFRTSMIKSNEKDIHYLYGQVLQSHKSNIQISSLIGLNDGAFKYDGTLWTRDKSALLMFLHLGEAVGLLTDFNSIKQSLLKKVKPTLSPNDPEFPAWWEEHKSEWEAPMKSIFSLKE